MLFEKISKNICFLHKRKYFLAYYVDAQALNDPITQYIEGRLANRRIFWCPSGYGM